MQNEQKLKIKWENSKAEYSNIKAEYSNRKLGILK
jgi:hypothetical protein